MASVPMIKKFSVFIEMYQMLSWTVDNMIVNLNGDVTEKVNIVSKLTDRTPEEVVNDALWKEFQKIEDIPDEIDDDKIWNMLDHDKPEGDDVLDNLIRIAEEGWD